jgi:hypothetical protein
MLAELTCNSEYFHITAKFASVRVSALMPISSSDTLAKLLFA